MKEDKDMAEKLIQLRVEENVKDSADEIFKAQGLTTQTAIKIFLTQVANTGDSPFTNLFTKKFN
jgi:DNA-damage-inducible protein J